MMVVTKYHQQVNSL